MRILSLDYGSKHIGLALSDESFTIARELGIWLPANFWKELASLISQHEIDKIIVGLPLGLAGQETQSTSNAKIFIEKLKRETKENFIQVILLSILGKNMKLRKSI